MPYFGRRAWLILCIVVTLACFWSLTAVPFLRQEYLKFTDSEYPKVVDSEYGPVSSVSGGVNPSSLVIEGLMDQIANERAARLVAEERLRALQEENDRLRRWRQ